MDVLFFFFPWEIEAFLLRMKAYHWSPFVTVSGSGVQYTSSKEERARRDPLRGHWSLPLLQPALAALTASRRRGRAPRFPSRTPPVCIWAVTETMLVGGRGLENVYVSVSLSFSLCSCLMGWQQPSQFLAFLPPLTGPIFWRVTMLPLLIRTLFLEILRLALMIPSLVLSGTQGE